MPSPLKGRLLVATPTLEGAAFARTVIYMVEHTDDGALGVVINRPSEVSVDGPFPTWSSFASDPRVLFLGGPVQPDALLCIARVTGAAAGAEELVGISLLSPGLGLVDLERHPLDVPVVQEMRVFLGYAGWGPRQVESEVVRGSWFVVDADPGDVLTPAPEALWRTVLKRQGGKLALFANAPPDLELN